MGADVIDWPGESPLAKPIKTLQLVRCVAECRARGASDCKLPRVRPDVPL